MHFRYYGSSMGRFFKPDSQFDGTPGNPQGWNLYTYVKGNPVNLNDPTGHVSIPAGKPEGHSFNQFMLAIEGMSGLSEGKGAIASDCPNRLYVPVFNTLTGELTWRDTNLNDTWGVTAQGRTKITNLFNELGGAPYVKDMYSAATKSNIQLTADGVIEVMAQHKLESGWRQSGTAWNYGNIKNATDANGKRKIGKYANREEGLEAYFGLIYAKFPEASVYLQNGRLNTLEFGVALRDPDQWFAWAEDPLYAAKLNNMLAGMVVILHPESQ